MRKDNQMALSSYESQSTKRYPKKQKANLSGSLYILMLFVMPFLFLLPTRAWPQDSMTFEERLLLMEREIRSLKERNIILENNVDRLQEQLAVKEETVIDTLRETVSADHPSETKESPSQLVVAYKKGLSIATEDDSFRLKMGGRVTSRFIAFDSGHPSDDEFSVERARLFTNVNLLEYYNLRIQFEFSDDPKLADCYLDINYDPRARLRIGQFKIPFGAEIQQSHKYLDFANRTVTIDSSGLATRDIGVMLHGHLWDERLQYQLAVLNGSGANTGDDNDAKDLVGRLVMRPFRTSEDEIFSDLHLGIAASRGDQNTDFSGRSLKTFTGTRFVTFAPDTIHSGDRIRLGTEFIWPFGSSSIKAEWIQMWLDDFKKDGLSEDTGFYLWYISATHLLTGEKKVSGRIVPNRSFDPIQGTWGAWEVAVRYAFYNIDEDLFKMGMAAGTDEGETYLFGLNWYLNEFLRVTFNYAHTEFDEDLLFDGDRIDDEDAFLVQCQLEF